MGPPRLTDGTLRVDRTIMVKVRVRSRVESCPNGPWVLGGRGLTVFGPVYVGHGGCPCVTGLGWPLKDHPESPCSSQRTRHTWGSGRWVHSGEGSPPGVDEWYPESPRTGGSEGGRPVRVLGPQEPVPHVTAWSRLWSVGEGTCPTDLLTSPRPVRLRKLQPRRFDSLPRPLPSFPVR